MRLRRGLRRAATGLALLLAAGAAGAQHDDTPTSLPPPPAGPATIRGAVLHAATGEPVPGAAVALYALSATGAPGVLRSISGADGAFVFENLSNDPSNSYLVGARHEGVPHPGGRVRFAPGQLEARVEVRVSDVVADPGAVQLAEASFRLDRLGGSVRVGQSFRLENNGAATYFVPRARREGRQPLLEVRLSEGASELDMPLGVMPEGLEREGDRLRYWGPVHPGPSELAWSFLLALDAEGGLRFSPPVPDGVGAVTLYVIEGAEVAAQGRLQGPEPASLDGRSYARFGADGDAPLELTLAFAASRVDPDALRVEEVRLVMQGDDAALDVQETHVLSVAGESGVRPAGDREPLLRIPLPERASNLRFGTSDPGLVLAPDPAGGIGVLGAAPPGESRVDLAYRLPAGAQGTLLSRSFDVPVPLVSMFLADTGRLAVSSDRLHRRRPVRTNDLTYMHFEAFEVAAGEDVSLRIAARPARGGPSRGALLSLLGVLAAGAILFIVAPLRGGRASTEAGAAPVEDASDRERSALYAAIRDLEHDFETGKVSEEDHRLLRSELRARAVALLREERAAATPAPGGAAVGAPAPSDRPCPGCGAAARAGDRFCAQCGHALSGGHDADAAPAEAPDGHPTGGVARDEGRA